MQDVGEYGGAIADLYTDTEWKHNPGERDCRKYEWWRAILNDSKEIVPYFDKDVKIVATVQLSSVEVERLFYQLTFIWRALGDNTMRDMMELR